MKKSTLASVFLGSMLVTNLGITGSASAEEVTVKAGQKTLIYQFGSYEGGCASSEYPTFKAKKTKNGNLSTNKGSFIIADGRCKGKRLKSTNVYYTPKPGFRGKDKARLSFGTPKDVYSDFGYDYTVVTMKITVE